MGHWAVAHGAVVLAPPGHGRLSRPSAIRYAVTSSATTPAGFQPSRHLELRFPSPVPGSVNKLRFGNQVLVASRQVIEAIAVIVVVV